MNNKNDVMFQFFEWYLPTTSNFWNKVSNLSKYIASIGIDIVWLPPAYKGSAGSYDVGYGVYDLYDLGEFDQKGSIKTKYGSKDEYLDAIKTLKNNNLKVLADIVFNQKMGADESESVIAIEDNPQNREQPISEPKEITAWTKFNFPRKK